MSTISASTTTTTAYKVTADTTGVLTLQTGATPTTAMTIDGSQNVGIGTASPGSKLHVKQSSADVGGLWVVSSANDSQVRLYNNGTVSAVSSTYQSTGSYMPLTFLTSDTERARIDSSGNLLVGRTSQIASERLAVESGVSSFFIRGRNTASSNPSGMAITYSGAAPNNAGNEFLYLEDSSAVRFAVRANGGVANYSANNANLSDERTKTDIVNAGSYLAKICAIPVRTFKYKDQTDDLLNLGVIAQEVEAVAPELVDVSGFGETPEDGVPLKAIYQTDLQYALMKCIQEQQAIITQLQADVAALKGAA